MGIQNTQPSNMTLTPGRGVREFSLPTDPAVFTGTAGIHFNTQLGGMQLLAGVPIAGANALGSVYLSAIHGGLGSDARNPAAAPAVGYNANMPAFPGPEVTGTYLPPSPLAADVKQNWLNNTEKILRTPNDNPNGNGTIWTGLEGRTNLNFSLWISRSATPLPLLLYSIELYRDLNAQDKVAGQFGAGTGPGDLENAQLLAQWTAPQALRNQRMPNLATAQPYPLPAGCNLYLLFRANDNAPGNLAVGSIWFS
jgi:hypothetical protein